MMMPLNKPLLASLSALLLLAGLPAATRAADCPARSQQGEMTLVSFADRSIAVRGHLHVNPDGMPASYLPGDHGFTYIVNGVDLWVGGQRRSCQTNRDECKAKFREAEAGGFGPGTAEFCAFALEVDPPQAGGTTQACTRGRVIGNGRGRPRIGGQLPTAAGGQTDFYASMTALTQLVEGKPRPLDAGLLPSVVVPVSQPGTLGRVVWVRHGERSTFAVVGDTGPAYGEGSVALHELLRHGALSGQKPGPIPLAQRCTAIETGLRAPFISRPDLAGDRCSDAGARRGPADIRAYQGIAAGVTQLILGRARVEMKGSVAQQPLSVEQLRVVAEAAGYDATKLSEMARCVE
ncbi:hypothetical protein [Roseateles violae]|uniref:Uncharacterized protein n=1 Tax=Roseateles violae TaxID=3058042 RepID=A0ABT8DR52_9BURK|nr:hypothetical protein [Pelomonas sp. PFR6]MDN3920817.1 hypothetical protein [Pelomonas sp. PFR6]